MGEKVKWYSGKVANCPPEQTFFRSREERSAGYHELETCSHCMPSWRPGKALGSAIQSPVAAGGRPAHGRPPFIPGLGTRNEAGRGRGCQRHV